MIQKTLAEILALLKTAEFDEDAIRSDLPVEVLEQYNFALKLDEEIKEVLQTNFLRRSAFGKHILKFYLLIRTKGITEDNYNQVGIETDYIVFLDLFYTIFKRVSSSYDHTTQINALSDLIINFCENECPGKRVQIDVELIYVLFLDYEIILLCKEAIKELSPEWKDIIDEVEKSVISSLRNAAEFIDEDLDNFVYSKGMAHGDNNNYRKFTFTPKMIQALRESLAPYIELNEKYLAYSLNKTVLGQMIGYLLNLDFDGIENFNFHKLKDAFLEDNELNYSNKMLLLHNVFLFYTHPKAISKDDEEFFLKNGKTFEDMKQIKKRAVNSIIK